MKTLLVCLTGLCCLSAPAKGETIDLRSCPLDTVTFVDPWVGGTFVVDRVGRDFNFFCDSGFVEEPVPDEICRGPFGDLALQGIVTSGGEAPRSIIAVYYVYPALPCCGWQFVEPDSDAGADLQGRVTWLSGADVPKLDDVSFLSIEDEEGDGGPFFNPMMAVSCALP